MSNSVGGQNQTRSVNPPHTPQEHSHLQRPGQIGRVKTTIKPIGPHLEQHLEQHTEPQQSTATDQAVTDPHPAFAAWWESWRESRTSLSVSPITKQS